MAMVDAQESKGRRVETPSSNEVLVDPADDRGRLGHDNQRTEVRKMGDIEDAMETDERRRTVTRNSDLDQFINCYNGPACWLRADRSLRAVSPVLAHLPFGDPEEGWWARLMIAVDSPGRDEEPFLVSEIPTAGQPRVVHWSATGLADGSVILVGRDATTETNLRKALVESRQRFRDLTGISADFAWETDTDGKFVYVSPEGALGWPAAALVGRSANTLLAEEEEISRSPFRVRRPVRHIDVALRRIDGEVVWVSLSARPAYDTAGRPIGVRGLWQEVTASRIRDAEMARAQTRDRLLVHLGSVLRDAGGPEDRLDEVAETIARSVGGAMVVLLRRSADGAMTAPGRFVVPDLEAVEGFAVKSHEIRGILAELEAQGADERPIRIDREDCHLTVVPTRFRQRINGALIVGVTPNRAPIPAGDVETLFAIAGQLGLANSNALFVEQLRYQAERDDLSGLYNRRAFMAFLDRRLGAESHGAVVFVDLNNFKLVNDRLGHHRGDSLLRAVAERLVGVLHPGDRAARIGGDEFLLWIDNGSSDRMATLAEALRVVGADVVTEEERLQTGFGLSVGVVWRRGEEGIDALIARADDLMYRAKEQSKKDGRGRTMIVMDDREAGGS